MSVAYQPEGDWLLGEKMQQANQVMRHWAPSNAGGSSFLYKSPPMYIEGLDANLLLYCDLWQLGQVACFFSKVFPQLHTIQSDLFIKTAVGMTTAMIINDRIKCSSSSWKNTKNPTKKSYRKRYPHSTHNIHERCLPRLISVHLIPPYFALYHVLQAIYKNYA